MDDGIVARHAGAGLQLVKASVSGQGVEHLPGIGQLDPQVVHAGMIKLDQIGIGDVVALFEQIGDGVATGLAAAAGEKDAHDVTLHLVRSTVSEGLAMAARAG